MCRLLSEPFPRRMTIKPSVALSPAHVTLPPDECSGTAPLTADMSKHTRKQPIRMQEQDTTKEEGQGSAVRYLLLHWFRHLPRLSGCPSRGGNNVNAHLRPIPAFERQSNCMLSCKDFVAAVGLKRIFNAQKKKWNFCCCFYTHAFIPLFLRDALCWRQYFFCTRKKPQRGDHVPFVLLSIISQ